MANPLLNLKALRYSQQGINMVDLMMWLVIAALMLATAIQSIGYYQQAAYVSQMSNDAENAGELAVAKASMANGVLTYEIVSSAVSETASTEEVFLSALDMGKGRYAVEATHPAITNNTVVYVFDKSDSLQPGINVKRSIPINYDQPFSLADKCADGQWFAQYYGNTKHEGAPAAERCEATVDYNWNQGGPAIAGLGTDNFGAKWSTNFTTTETQVYEFTNLSDNRSNIYLDGKLVMSSEWYGSWETQKAKVQIPAGKHNIHIVYVEYGGGASMKFKYAPIG